VPAHGTEQPAKVAPFVGGDEADVRKMAAGYFSHGLGPSNQDAVIAAAETAQVGLDFRLAVGIEGNETDRECAVAGQSLHGLIRIRLSCQSLPQQCQEQSKRCRIESAQLGEPGLAVGDEALACGLGLGGFFRNVCPE
jgi:hypothetical protein